MENDRQELQARRSPASDESALRLALLQELCEASPDGCVALSAEGLVLFANQRLAKLWGEPLPPLRAGAHFEEVLPQAAALSQDPHRFEQKFRLLLESAAGAFTIDMELRTGLVLECSWAQLPAGQGEPPGRLCSFRDMTGPRLIERDLKTRSQRQAVLQRLSQRALRAAQIGPLLEEAALEIAAALPVDLCLVTELLPDGQSVAIRGSAGFRQSNLMDRRLTATDQTDLGQAMNSEGPLLSAAASGETRFLPLSLLLAEQVSSSATLPIRGAHGPFGTLGVHSRTPRGFHPAELEFIGAICTLLGAAVDRLSAAEALQASERSFRGMIENAPDLVFVHRGGRILYVNQAALVALGHAALGGRALLDFIHADERQEMVEQIRDAQNGLVPPLQEFRMLRENGTELQVECRGIRVNLGGQPAVLTSGRDVSERRELQARLQMSDRLASVGTLAAGVAHELNNPLAYVSANLGYLADVLPRLTSADQRLVQEMIAAVSEAREGSDRMREIVRDMKTFSRSDETERTAVDLRRVAESALRLAGGELRHRATVIKELGEVPPVLGNEGRLGQVCINLLVNAAQALPPDRFAQNQITIRTSTDDEGRAILSVLDTGCGIGPENLARIFDPFFTTKPVGVGTGLGLSICHSLIEAHGGHIEVKSKLGEGTVFSIVLPAMAPHALSSRGAA